MNYIYPQLGEAEMIFSISLWVYKEKKLFQKWFSLVNYIFPQLRETATKGKNWANSCVHLVE